jgi:hypothetical protein
VAQWIEPSVTYTVEVAFASTPWATAPTWTDVSAYTRAVNVNRGSSSETAVFSPGTCSVTFSNADRRFDPDYSAGPYFGTILPMKRIRVTATRSAVTFTVFLGWVTGWTQDWQVGDGVAYANCVDGGYFAQNASLGASAYEGEVKLDTPTHYWTMQGASIGRDFGSADVDLAVRPGTEGAAVLYPRGLVDAVAQVELAQPIGGGLYAQEIYAYGDTSLITVNPKAIEFWSNVSGNSLPAIGFGGTTTDYMLVDAGTVSYSNTSDNRNGSAAFPPQADGPHHFAAYADATNLYLIVDGQLVSTTALSVGTSSFAGGLVTRDFIRSWAPSPGPGGVSHVALYATAPSLARFQAHYMAGSTAYGHPYNECEGTRIGRVLDEIGYPSNLRDISAGGMVQGPYLPAERRAMEYIGDCVNSGQGLLFFSVDGKLTYRDRAWQWISADADGVIFSDDGAVGAVGYEEGSPTSGTVDTVRNIVTVSYSDVGGITNRDTASVSAYGPSQQFIDGPTIRNGTDASNLGKYVLRLKKDPKSTIPSLVVKLRANIGTNLAACLGLDIGEVVTVERTPMGVGSQIVRRHQVTGISHTIAPDNWSVRFYLSPAVPMADEVPYFTIADATYGRVGAPAGNKIPG